MPSGGKRANVRKVKDPRGGKRAFQPGRPTNEQRAWVFSMWDKHSKKYWEDELEKGNPKAHYEVLKRTHPEVAKTIISGDDESDPITITLISPHAKKDE